MNPVTYWTCGFTWTASHGATGSSSYTVIAANAHEAREKTKKAFIRDFPGYTFGEFLTCRPTL